MRLLHRGFWPDLPFFPVAVGCQRRATSTITSPTTSARPGIPSLRRFSAAVSEEQSRRSLNRSVAIRLRSSGIVEVE